MVEVDNIESIDNSRVEPAEVTQGTASPFLSPIGSDFNNNQHLAGAKPTNSSGFTSTFSMATGAPGPRDGDPPPILINPLVQPRGLLIEVPRSLEAATIPPNLPLFRRSQNEDPLTHVE